MLQVLPDLELYEKLSKRELWFDFLAFFDHIVSNAGTVVYTHKILDVKNLAKLMTLAEVHRFIGLVGLHRRFVEGFSSL